MRGKVCDNNCAGAITRMGVRLSCLAVEKAFYLPCDGCDQYQRGIDRVDVSARNGASRVPDLKPRLAT